MQGRRAIESACSACERWLARPDVERTLLVGLAFWSIVEFAEFAKALGYDRDGASILIGTAIVVSLAALVSSIAGFAFSALAGSALAYLGMDPVHAVRTMAFCSIAIQLYGVWKIRPFIDWRSLRPMIAAGAVTIPVGVWLLVHIDGVIYAAGLGVFLMSYGCYRVMRGKTRVVAVTPWRDAAVGALGGLAGGLAALPGSFVTIWCSMRGLDKLQQRAIYQPYILVMQLVTIGCLRWQAPASTGDAQSLCFVPFALLGAIAGFAVFERMTGKQFQTVVSGLLVVSGAGLLTRVL